MPEVLRQEKRKASKIHSCSYCGETIEKCEVYDYATCKFDGSIYGWKSHERCSYIASELWRFIDPDDGMTEEDFQDGCANFCQHFICPHCNQMVSETEECSEDNYCCLDKIYDFLQTHKLKRTDSWCGRWVAEERNLNT